MLLNYDATIVKKEPFPELGLFKMPDFYCSDRHKISHYVLSARRSKRLCLEMTSSLSKLCDTGVKYDDVISPSKMVELC